MGHIWGWDAFLLEFWHVGTVALPHVWLGQQGPAGGEAGWGSQWGGRVPAALL